MLLLAILIAAGVTLGVVLSKKNSSAASSSSSAPPGTNPSNPSNFQKNPALKHAFWGIAYTPLGAQLPECGVTLGESSTMLSDALLTIHRFRYRGHSGT